MKLEAEELIKYLQNSLDRITKAQEYFVARNERLEDENRYLKNQIDVLLKVIGKDKDGNQD